MRMRLAISIVAVIIGLVLLQWLLTRSPLPNIPADKYLIFPAETKFGFLFDPTASLAYLPANVLEKLPVRGRALAAASRIYIGCTEDLGEVFLVLEGAPPLDEIAPVLAGKEFSHTSVAGLDAISFTDGCVAMIAPDCLFAVFSEKPAERMNKILTRPADLAGLDKNIAKQFAEHSEGSLVRICGFPGPNTPPLMPGDAPYLLQQKTHFFSLNLYGRGADSILARLNLYFEADEARDLMAMTIPTMVNDYARQYQFLAILVKNIQYFARGANSNLRMELVFPSAIFESFVNPPPPPPPLIPDIPEFPF